MPSVQCRGYSLVELIVAVAIGLLIVAGALGLMVGQQHAFQQTAADRGMQETARIALENIGGNLGQAGYGVDPALVFDFGQEAAARMQAGYNNGAAFTTASTDSCPAQPVACRDSTNQPDEISFLSRDPQFGPHPLLAPPTSGTLTIAGPLSVPLMQGQLLQVMCYTGSMTWAYVTVSQYQAATTNSSIQIHITAGTSVFPNQTSSFSDSCYTLVATPDTTVTTFPQVSASSLLTAAKVFKIDRYHYYIQSYDSTGKVVGWGAANSRPYLMLDQGLTDQNGNRVNNVITPDVEDLQFAYDFPLATANQLVGATTGTAIATDDTGINLATTAPIYSDAETSATKMTHHPGNIRGVQVSLVVRSSGPDVGSTGDNLPAAGNRAAMARSDGYRRLLIQSTVAVPNLSALLPLYPYYDTSGASQLNAGGG